MERNTAHELETVFRVCISRCTHSCLVGSRERLGPTSFRV